MLLITVSVSSFGLSPHETTVRVVQFVVATATLVVRLLAALYIGRYPLITCQQVCSEYSQNGPSRPANG